MKRILTWVLAVILLVGGTLRFFPIFPPLKALWILQLLTSELGLFGATVLVVLLALPSVRKDSFLLFFAGTACFVAVLPLYEMLAQERNWLWDLRYASQTSPRPTPGVSNPYTDSSESLFRFQDFFHPPRHSEAQAEFVTTRDGAVLPIYIYRPLIQNIENPVKGWIFSVHGGGWDSGTPQDLDSTYVPYLRAGYTVITPSYRFAPTFPWPKQLEDIEDAFFWVSKNSERLNVDMNRYWAFGRSAGGQIALKFAYGKVKTSGLKGVISLYAPTDLEFGYRWSFENDVLNSRRLLQSLTGATPDANPSAYQAASPIFDADGSSVPTLLITGRADPLVWFRHSERLSDHLHLVGAPVTRIELPWGTHGFDFFANSPGGQLTSNAVLYFMRGTKGPL